MKSNDKLYDYDPKKIIEHIYDILKDHIKDKKFDISDIRLYDHDEGEWEDIKRDDQY